MCLAGEVCAAGPGACGGCVPAEIVRGARGLGEGCSEDAECGSGACLVDGDASYCTRSCDTDADCGDEYHCRATDEGKVCVVGERGGAGSPCNVNSDCTSDLFCAARGGASWCTSFCTADSECPGGFTCAAVSAEVSVCAPEAAGVLGEACADASECLSGFCQPVGPGGELQCSRLCGTDSTCGPGFECVRAAGGRDAVCVAVLPASTGGGCSVTGGSSGGPPWTLLPLAALLLALRRRVRR